MSSILTNNGAMVALQTLKSINNDLGKTQSLISTGKMVANAKDNSAVWAIAKTMESDVQGFKAISSSLRLGESTVTVARQASETVTDLLTQMKDKIVASQESNVDRDKIQSDIDALSSQIESVVGAAQFNGLSLLNNTGNSAASASGTDTALDFVDSRNVDVLSSLDRSGSGVAAANISVAKQDLGRSAATAGTTGEEVGNALTNLAIGATGTFATLQAEDTTNNIYAGMTFEATAAGITDNANGDTRDLAGNATYVARDGDTLGEVTRQLVARLNVEAAEAGLEYNFTADGTTEGQINITNNSSEAIDVDSAMVNQADSADAVTEADGEVGGGLELLTDIDVTSDDGAAAGLAAIESLIQTSINSAAEFGSVQGRIETQADFISSLTDALKSGIGALVDANMEEASARLQALQVQQQLGVQSLSIANQAPQSILSLFR